MLARGRVPSLPCCLMVNGCMMSSGPATRHAAAHAFSRACDVAFFGVRGRIQDLHRCLELQGLKDQLFRFDVGNFMVQGMQPSYGLPRSAPLPKKVPPPPFFQATV